MLDDYKIGQSNIYNLFVNAVKNNKLMHAYLIDSNNNTDSLDIILAIVKMLICPHNYTNLDNCQNCNLCKRINEGNYLEIKIIKPDGNFIKKDQIISLQEDFAKVSIEGTKRIYIILDSDRMNDSTSNSLLKFLEEPRDNIIAFLVSNNINQVLSTIRSRCQIIKLQKNKSNYSTTIEKLGSLLCNSHVEFDQFVGLESNKKLITSTLDYISYYEKNNFNTIIMNDKLLNFKSKTKEEILIIFDIMINFYYDVLLKKYNMDVKLFADYLDMIDDICNKNKKEDIIKKIEILIEYRELIRYNLNVNLLFDDMIIKFEGD